ncbi:MAG: hypothetical protein ABIH34_07385 [Nanoarchaeota archaeon]
MFKIIKNLGHDGFISATPLGEGRTNARIIKLNWQHPLQENVLSLFLASEANEQERWQTMFKALESLTDFCILFGSVLRDPKHANDIDIMCVVSKKERFTLLDKTLLQIQRTQLKKIHGILLTEKELMNELQNGNRAYIDSIRQGAVLSGFGTFIAFIKHLHHEKN